MGVIKINYQLNNEEWEIFTDISFILNSVLDIDLLCKNFLQQTGKLVGYEKAAVFLFVSSQERLINCAQIRCERSFIDGYIEKYLRKDYLSWLYYQEETGLYRESDYFPFEAKKDSVFYKEFLSKYNIEHRCGFNILVEGEVIGFVAFYRSRFFGDFSDREVWIIGRLQSHLLAAIEKSRRYEKLKANTNVNLLVYENISDGVVFLDNNYQITYKNKTAREKIADLKLRQPEVYQDFVEYLEATCRRLTGDYLARSQASGASNGYEEVHGDYLYTFNLVEAHPIGSADDLEFVVLFRPNPAMPLKPPVEQSPKAAGDSNDMDLFLQTLFQQFGFTKREAELADLVLKGLDNKEIAAQLFISLSTVKSHLQNMFAKINIKNRYQLMSLFFNFYQYKEFREGFLRGELPQKTNGEEAED
ncbi:MAG: LuxR C-terminal-related transcriptional regulator [Clostridia bacterium]|nr:LuxR C-terminal-related transcriptional regulator [Clostridia bacterium]